MSAIVVGNAASVLRRIPAGLAQACITSPPYWGLRDYELAQQIGSEDKLSAYLGRLARVFGLLSSVVRPDGVLWLNIGDTYTSGNRGWRAQDKTKSRSGKRLEARQPSGNEE